MKTAEELNITPEELGALVRVRGMLASGQIEAEGTSMLDMSLPAESYFCHTSACIGGWMSILMMDHSVDDDGLYTFDEEKADRYVAGAQSSARPIKDLFYPPARFEYEAITPSQAVEAIDRFLTTGAPDWQLILEGTSADQDTEE